MRKFLRVVSLVFLVIMLTALAFGAGFGSALRFGVAPTPKAQSSSSIQDRFKVFWQAWDVVQQQYVDRDSLDPETLTRGAIKGMLQSLGDPHTVYIDPESLKYEQEEFSASFGGIGATVTIRDDVVTVIAPIENSPASEAGIRAGDRILRVNGEDTTKMTLQDAVSKIRGPKGTKVKLTILHDGDKSPVEIEVARGDIKTVSVYSEMLPNAIAHIRISHFSRRTTEEMVAKLQELRKGELKGIILDLRDNPGGFLDITVETTSQFLKGGVVCYEVDAKGKRDEWKVKPGGLATEVPLVVLVNKGSASGSEILAAGIQENGRGPLIGEETFGKGEAQRQYDLSDGSAIAVTVSRWLTPKGRQIEGKGLAPDIEVKMTLDDFKANGDIQLSRAVEYITTGK
ncbi:MAG: S41 family peptidase [Chloroflexi bacterium]|nr:S41 family peptidase [Chloroflexota bacterium]